jgi:hypothetical protein
MDHPVRRVAVGSAHKAAVVDSVLSQTLARVRKAVAVGSVHKAAVVDSVHRVAAVSAHKAAVVDSAPKLRVNGLRVVVNDLDNAHSTTTNLVVPPVVLLKP